MSTPTEFAAVIDEFAPAIRLPEGGSFEVWRARWAGLPPSTWDAVVRHHVVSGMVIVARCQWTQRWLDDSVRGDVGGMAQSVSVLEGIRRWMGQAGVDDSATIADLLNQIHEGARGRVQFAVHQGCAYTGVWGTTSGQQDAHATSDLLSAAPVARGYLRAGGSPAAFDPASASELAPDVVWTWHHMQPDPAEPGVIFIAPSAGEGVTLVSVSESGTQFCVVVTANDVGRGTTDHDLSVTDPGDGPVAVDPSPVECDPDGW